MKLWLICQNDNNGYDTFDSAVVAAETEEDARSISPAGTWENDWDSWASSPKTVDCELLGEAKDGNKHGIVVSSYNAR